MPIPEPTSGETQNDFVSRCISQLAEEDPEIPQDQAVAICFDTFRRTKGESKMTKSTIRNWQKLKFNVPIMEAVMIGNDFLIKGVAINETTTRNGVRYTGEELSKSALTLRNKPILKDHDNSVDSIVGRTTENVNFDTMNKNVTFEGKIMDESIIEKIKDGRIQSVSVGGIVKDLPETHDEESGEHFATAIGIEFVELSLVAVPADPDAGFARALLESFELKQTEKNKEENKMEQEAKVVEETKEVVSENNNNEVLEAIKALNEKVGSMQEELIKIKEQDEAPAEEAPAEKVAEESVEDETKGEVGVAEETTEEVNTDYVVERAETGRGYSIYAKEYDKAKFKRLGR